MEPNTLDQNPTLPLVEHEVPESRPIPPETQDLHKRVEDLDSAVRSLSRVVSAEGRSPEGAGPTSVAGQRFSPLVDRAELVALADWLDFYQEYYDPGTMWIDPCWWRHTMVVQELAALRGAWMAVYQSDEPVHGGAALQFHEAAVRCRSRVREALYNGSGCNPTSHTGEKPNSRDQSWIEGGQELRRWVTEGGSDIERRGTGTWK